MFLYSGMKAYTSFTRYQRIEPYSIWGGSNDYSCIAYSMSAVENDYRIISYASLHTVTYPNKH